MRKTIQNISFIGSGNVALHLGVAFKKAGVQIREVYSPNAAHTMQFASATGSKAVKAPAELDAHVDLCLICVPDAQVSLVFDQLPAIEGIVAHTSGITSIEVLGSAKHSGVLYPLQTFTKNKALDLHNVPFCIEGSDDETEEQLMVLSKKISSNIHLINSEQRKYLHLAAVMVNNFTNHLYSMAGEIMDSKGMDFELLQPLIRETANKIKDIHPGKAQTGPAKRNDQSTIAVHMELLKSMPEYAALYQLMTQQINKKHYG